MFIGFLEEILKKKFYICGTAKGATKKQVLDFFKVYVRAYKRSIEDTKEGFVE